MRLAISWPVAAEYDPIIGAVNWRDVVIGRGLIWNLGDDRNGGRVGEVGDLVKLPIFDRIVIVLVTRRAHHHAEDRFHSAPMHTGLAHGNAVGVLRCINAKTGRTRKVLQRSIRVADVEIATPAATIGSRPLISEDGTDGRKIGRN